MSTFSLIQIILTIAGGLVAIIAALAGLFAAIGYYQQGKASAKNGETENANSTIEMFKNRADGLEKDLKEYKIKADTDFIKLRNEFEAYKKEVLVKEENYKKTNAQQEDLIKTYAALLQNRNPELEKILSEIRDFLKQLKEATAHQTVILESQQKREVIIDAK